MVRWFIWSFLCLCGLIAYSLPSAFAIESTPYAEAEPELIIQNKILATINGKTISVMDVVKKLDMHLQKYPEFAKSSRNRYQFLNAHWKETLNQMIDAELMIADAVKLELKISDAEIRETIHERFGPNIMASLDQIGLTLDEVWKMIYAEIAVQRMSWYRVHSKAIQKVGPQEIKDAYQRHLIKNPQKETWKYQVLSIRAATEQMSTLYAQKAQELISGNFSTAPSFETLVAQIKKEGETDQTLEVTLSDEYSVEDKDLSKGHKEILATLKVSSYSPPVAQVNRVTGQMVQRIFYLKDHQILPQPSFDSLVEKLRDELIQKEVDVELPAYLKRLRERFNVSSEEKLIPPDFQPFSLKS